MSAETIISSIGGAVTQVISATKTPTQAGPVSQPQLAPQVTPTTPMSNNTKYILGGVALVLAVMFLRK